MYLKEDHMIPVIKRLEDLREIDNQSRRIARDEWIAAAIGSAAAIALIFTLAAILNQ